MKITTFNPKIITKDAESAVGLFEALGFEKRHEISVVDGKNITNRRMKDEKGFYVDIADVKDIPQDLMVIRINVDDFGEAYELRGLKRCGK